LQVNTSGEDTKSGVSPGEEVLALATFIKEECPALILEGLMTIGAPGDFSDFDLLRESRKEVAEALVRSTSRAKRQIKKNDITH